MNEENESLGTDQQQAENSTDPAVEGDEGKSGEMGEATHEELLLTLQDAQAKADEYWNQLLRAQAELDNFQRRSRRELENAHKFALEKIVRELLPVIDSLELGLAAAAQDQDAADASRLREGMELTLKMLLSATEKFGVKVVDPVGEVFNPELHQAMTTQSSAEVAPNTVLSVYQKGYLLNDRLIRPAMVVVAAAGKPAGHESAENDGEKPAKIDEHA